MNIFRRLIFGTASLGSKISHRRSVSIVRHAANKGIYRFDSSPLYGACQSQSILSSALAGKPNIEIYSKVLGSPSSSLWRELLKIIYRRNGIKAYLNLIDSMRLATTAKRLDERSNTYNAIITLIEEFKSKQISRYPELRFSGWFFHSPTLLQVDRLCSLPGLSSYHCCGYNCTNIGRFSQGRIIQIHADLVSPEMLAKLSFADQVWVHGINSSRNPLLPPESTAKYRYLISLGSNICLVAGATRIASLESIINRYRQSLSDLNLLP